MSVAGVRVVEFGTKLYLVVADEGGKLLSTTGERRAGANGCATVADVDGNDVIGAYRSPQDATPAGLSGYVQLPRETRGCLPQRRPGVRGLFRLRPPGERSPHLPQLLRTASSGSALLRATIVVTSHLAVHPTD